MAPFAVGLASLIVQTHLSFVYVIALVGVTSVAGAVWSVRAARQRGSAGGANVRRIGVATVVVAVLAWIQPLVDQVAGEGNLGALLAAGRSSDADRIGLGLGARLVSSVVALPPWWTRSGFSDTIVATGLVSSTSGTDVAQGNVASGPIAALGLLVVALLLAGVVVVGRRRQTPSVVLLGVLAAVAVAAALVSMVLSPVNFIGLSPHQMRWLWPISALVFAAVLYPLAAFAPRTVTRPVAFVPIALFAVLALPTYAAPEGPTADRAYTDTVADLTGQLDGYEPEGRVFFDVSDLRFAEPYSGPTLAALARNGVDVVADADTARQIGSGRLADGTERLRLYLREGDAAAAQPAGARRVAFVDGLSPAERVELDGLRGEVLADIAAGGLVLNQGGLDAAAGGRIGFEELVVAPGGDATDLEAGGWLTALIQEGWVDAPEGAADRWRRYAELDLRGARFTVGLFEEPMAPG
jgi:hypothetical protein